MTSALHTARSGLDAQDMRMRVISNNLANVNTTGFKRDRAEFETLMYQNYKQAGANSDQTNQYATGLNIGTGVKVVGTERINTQGAMQATDNRSEEHTSELQSLMRISYAVFCLKKKKN